MTKQWPFMSKPPAEAKAEFDAEMTEAEAALPMLHKLRYELTGVPDELRHESRAWLESQGFGRYKNFPWPPKGELER
jgi:hypothetical protein